MYENLPIVFNQFPNLTVHAFRTEPGLTLAKKFKVHKTIIWHNLLSQKDFSQLIKQSNIVFTITGDAGIGGTALQASYAGCVNLMKNSSVSAGILDNNVNALMCVPESTCVLSKLIYSIEHLPGLCTRFKENNKHLIKYDQENTWKGFYQALLACLEGEKDKIVPTCTATISEYALPPTKKVKRDKRITINKKKLMKTAWIDLKAIFLKAPAIPRAPIGQVPLGPRSALRKK